MAKKIKTATPSDETKAQKFSRLATKRVNTALAKIKLIGNLAGAGYEYTPEQVGTITKALAETCKATLAKFDKSAKKEVEGGVTL